MLISVKPDGLASFRSVAHDRLERLCRALGARPLLATRASSIFDALSGSWGDMTPSAEPLWRNDICDDGTPFEFSLAFGRKGVELRMLVEPQDAPFTLASNWEAGLAVHERLARTEGADLTRFDLIRDLFAPSGRTDATFALWHAVVIDATARAFFKVYLNPQIHGPERAPGIVREALLRLDLPDVAAFIDARAGEPDALRYFSLDLIPGDEARVKIYVARRGSADEVEELMVGTRNFERGRATECLAQLAGHTGPFPERPILTCFAFDGGAAAPNATLHVPIRCYCPDDATALARIGEFLPLPHAAQLRRAAASLADRDLRRGRGLVTYASIRPEAGSTRTTIYLAPQLHRAPVERPAPPANMREVEVEIDRQCEAIIAHPFIRRLEGPATLAEVRAVLPRLAFFIGAFQDVLRLSQSHCTDPRLVELARGFADGDRGHEFWYLADLARLGIPLDVPWLFSDHHAVTRQTAYSLIGLTVGAKDDRSRIAVTLVLEATAEAFFPRMAALIARLGASDGLSFFGGVHIEAEKNHEAFTDQGQALLASIEVPASTLPELRATIDRAFEAMWKLADDLDGAMRAAGSAS